MQKHLHRCATHSLPDDQARMLGSVIVHPSKKDRIKTLFDAVSSFLSPGGRRSCGPWRCRTEQPVAFRSDLRFLRIPSPKSERVRRAWIPTSSLIRKGNFLRLVRYLAVAAVRGSAAFVRGGSVASRGGWEARDTLFDYPESRVGRELASAPQGWAEGPQTSGGEGQADTQEAGEGGERLGSKSWHWSRPKILSCWREGV